MQGHSGTAADPRTLLAHEPSKVGSVYKQLWVLSLQATFGFVPTSNAVNTDALKDAEGFGHT